MPSRPPSVWGSCWLDDPAEYAVEADTPRLGRAPPAAGPPGASAGGAAAAVGGCCGRRGGRASPPPPPLSSWLPATASLLLLLLLLLLLTLLPPPPLELLLLAFTPALDGVGAPRGLDRLGVVELPRETGNGGTSETGPAAEVSACACCEPPPR